MSEIKVPEGMLEAAHKALGGFTSHTAIERGLEAALRWLSEQSIVPTRDQVEMLVAESPLLDPLDQHRRIARRWMQIAFLAHEPVEEWTDRILAQFPSGYTPTHDELDKLWNNLFRAGHGWVPPEQRAEIKAEQEVEDLLFRADVDEKGRSMSGNERIKEAYRRGKAGK